MTTKWDDVVMYVGFNFGSYVYLTVRVYEGKSLAECVRMRSEDIDTYLNPDTNKWKSVE